MNPQRIINLYHFLRRSEELELPFTVPRLAALAACNIDTQNSGTLVEMFGASQSFWSVTLKELSDVGLVKNVTKTGWKHFKTTYTGRTVLFVLDDAMNLKVKHDSRRVKTALRKCQTGGSCSRKVQPVQDVGVQETHGPSPLGGETR